MFVLDRETIIRRSGDIPDVLKTLAVIFIEDLDLYLSSIERALAAGDAERIGQEAHSIKGMLATFADVEGAQMAHKLIQQVREQGISADTVCQVAVLRARMLEVANVLQTEVL